LTKALAVYLEEEKEQPDSQANRRNGYSKKTVKGEFGEAEMAIPRDRNGNFEPILVPKREGRLVGFDEKIKDALNFTFSRLFKTKNNIGDKQKC
jgi:putative transposase